MRDTRILTSVAKGRSRLSLAIVLLVIVASVGLFGSALATPPSGTLTAETARAPLGKTKINKTFDNGATLKLETTGDLEMIVQKVMAEPGTSFGWHSHPGPNVNVVMQGTLTLYHDDHCTEGMTYGPGTSFKSFPKQIHLARNNGTEPLVLFATYFAARTSPEQPTRIDQPSPGVDCAQ
jgi:quercetin dioxygenase-like cupin family protein